MVYLEVTMSHAILLVLLVIGSSLFVSYQAGNLILDVMVNSTKENKKNLRMIISTSGIMMNVSIISCVFFLICNGAQYNESVLEFVDNLLDVLLVMALAINACLHYFIFKINDDLKKNGGVNNKIYFSDLTRYDRIIFKNLNIFDSVEHKTQTACFFCKMVRLLLSTSLMFGVVTSNTIILMSYNKSIKSRSIDYYRKNQAELLLLADMVV